MFDHSSFLTAEAHSWASHGQSSKYSTPQANNNSEAKIVINQCPIFFGGLPTIVVHATTRNKKVAMTGALKKSSITGWSVGLHASMAFWICSHTRICSMIWRIFPLENPRSMGDLWGTLFFLGVSLVLTGRRGFVPFETGDFLPPWCIRGRKSIITI